MEPYYLERENQRLSSSSSSLNFASVKEEYTIRVHLLKRVITLHFVFDLH